MSRPRARWLPLSLPRRLVADALRACRGVPTVTAERRMDLSELADGRRAWATRPAWSAVLAKAFALVAAAGRPGGRHAPPAHRPDRDAALRPVRPRRPARHAPDVRPPRPRRRHRRPRLGRAGGGPARPAAGRAAPPLCRTDFQSVLF